MDGTTTTTYASSTEPPTEVSTNTTEANECDAIEAGDTYFTYVQSNAPNEVVLFPFEDIPGGIKLYLTDNA